MKNIPETLTLPRPIDLYDTPQEGFEETLVGVRDRRARPEMHIMFAELAELQASMVDYPAVPMGASDPYSPKPAMSRYPRHRRPTLKAEPSFTNVERIDP